MKKIINEIKQKIEELEHLIDSNADKKLDVKCYVLNEIEYVDLNSGTNKDKLKRICDQINDLQINIIRNSNDSRNLRSAIVSTVGDDGIQYWLTLRKYAKNFDEDQQITRYLYLLSRRSTNKMSFGIIVNLYKIAIDNYNNKLYKTKIYE